MVQPVLEMSDVEVYRSSRKVLAIEQLVVQRGEIVSVIGPNGSGKSTLLQASGTLLPCRSGRISLFGEPVTSRNGLKLRRRTALLLQEPVFIRDTVFNNVALPLKLRGYRLPDFDARVRQALETVGCEHLIGRQAHQLSGGEAQRVCLARALVAEPEMLFLDEPFSALDPAARNEMLSEFRQIIASRGLTAIIVSHSMDDVLFLSERTLVLESGHIIQQGRPEDILRRPVSGAIARLAGLDNILPCRVENTDAGSIVTLSASLAVFCPGQSSTGASVCCFPGDIFSVADIEEAKPGSIAIDGIVQRVIPGIGVNQVIIETGGILIQARLPRQQAERLAIPEKNIRLLFNPQDLQLV